MSLDIIVPKRIGFRKHRLGVNRDGGYIWPTGLRVDALLSYGVGDDVSFELDFHRVHRTFVRCYDPNVSGLPVASHPLGVQFTREPASRVNVPRHVAGMTFPAPSITRLGLKMDVEGAEWEALDDVDLAAVFDVIAIELHDVAERSRRSQLLPRLAGGFECLHVHASNFSPLVNGHPDVIESTWVNKRLCPADPAVDRENPYPGEHDYACDPSQPDHPCTWWKT